MEMHKEENHKEETKEKTGDQSSGIQEEQNMVEDVTKQSQNTDLSYSKCKSLKPKQTWKHMS